MSGADSTVGGGLAAEVAEILDGARFRQRRLSELNKRGISGPSTNTDSLAMQP